MTGPAALAAVLLLGYIGTDLARWADTWIWGKR